MREGFVSIYIYMAVCHNHCSERGCLNLVRIPCAHLVLSVPGRNYRTLCVFNSPRPCAQKALLILVRSRSRLCLFFVRPFLRMRSAGRAAPSHPRPCAQPCAHLVRNTQDEKDEKRLQAKGLRPKQATGAADACSLFSYVSI